MALKQFRPTSPGRRQLVIVDRGELYKGKPVKALTEGLTKSGGRNNLGRVTAFRHGGGHKGGGHKGGGHKGGHGNKGGGGGGGHKGKKHFHNKKKNEGQ